MKARRLQLLDMEAAARVHREAFRGPLDAPPVGGPALCVRGASAGFKDILAEPVPSARVPGPRRPKNRGPFHAVPVMARATVERLL